MNPDEIRKQIAQLQLDLEKAEREEAAKRVVCRVYDGSIHFDQISFKVHPLTNEARQKLNSIGGIRIPYDLKSFSCDVDYWKLVVSDIIKKDPVFDLEVSDILIAKLIDWTPPPAVFADYNKEHTVVVFDLHPNASNIPLRKDPVLFHNGYNKYTLNVSSLILLDNIKAEYNRLYPKLNIVFSEAVTSDLDKLRAKNAKIAAITEGDGSDLAPVTLGPITLRNFQAQALEFVKENDGSGIVALEMGLGKTPTALAFMKWYWEYIDAKQKFLVVGPASLRPNWTSEVRKYLDETTYQIYNTKPSQMDVSELLIGESYRVFYANFEALSRAIKGEDEEGKHHSIFPWTPIINMASLRAIIDEAHYLKSPESARTRMMFECKFKSVMLLTGTPMKNGPKELYSLVRLIDPEFAGSAAGWEKTHTYDNGRRARDPEQLRTLLQPIMFRRLKKDVIKDLPPINRITLQYELTPYAKGLYNQILAGFYQSLEKWTGNMADSDVIQNLLVQLMRMKQVTSEDKVDFVVERALETADSDESDYGKVIIFSQFANEPPIVDRIAAKLGHEAVKFTGNDDVFARQKVVDQFQTDPNVRFLVCSTKAAQEGLNITAAGHVIFVDFMWSPSDHSQAEGRAYGRLADLHSITSTYIAAEGTVDDHIIGILMRKFSQISAIVDGQDLSQESVTKELLGELRNLRMLR